MKITRKGQAQAELSLMAQMLLADENLIRLAAGVSGRNVPTPGTYDPSQTVTIRLDEMRALCLTSATGVHVLGMIARKEL